MPFSFTNGTVNPHVKTVFNLKKIDDDKKKEIKEMKDKNMIKND